MCALDEALDLFLCSVGAKRVKGLCVNFKDYCEAQNYEG